MKLEAVRQINGDLRIDDADEQAPMLKLEFFGMFAKLEDEEKDEILQTILVKMAEFFQDTPNRREAIAHTKSKKKLSDG